MTIEAALFAAGAILLSALIWQTHRVNKRRLAELQNEVSGLRDIVSRLFLMAVSGRSESKAPAPPPQADPVEKKDDHPTSRQLDMELELARVDELCAKLAPPKEALPLTSDKETSVRFHRGAISWD
jgi:hypothetical protein